METNFYTLKSVIGNCIYSHGVMMVNSPSQRLTGAIGGRRPTFITATHYVTKNVEESSNRFIAGMMFAATSFYTVHKFLDLSNEKFLNIEQDRNL